MNIRSIAPNQIEVTTSRACVLVSYSTPVAAYIRASAEYVRTSEHYSATTTKHINAWLSGAPAREVTPEELQELID